jgi:RND family efflux transporter MFP subunit
VQRISIQRQVDLAGTLISPDHARISSEVAGVIREVLVELGQEVKPGQPLIRLEPRELELALKQAVSLLRQTEAQLGIDGVRIKEPPPDEDIATVRTATANLEDARAQRERALRLKQRNLLAQADLDAAETRVKVSEAAYQSALETVQGLKASLQQRRLAVELAEKKLADSVIRAPVAGSVSERLVYPGEFIRENTHVITVVQMHPLKLRTAVQERHASLIRPGLAVKFRVESYPESIFDGTVAQVSPAVDQATRTFPVEVLVNNFDRRLKPGFFAKGVIFTRLDENVLAVPESAISTLAGVTTVFVIENNKVRQQNVTLGVREGETAEVISGLNGNELLASSNLSQLSTGATVETDAGGRAESPMSKAKAAPADKGVGP